MTGLPQTRGCSAVLKVVARLSTCATRIPCDKDTKAHRMSRRRGSGSYMMAATQGYGEGLGMRAQRICRQSCLGITLGPVFMLRLTSAIAHTCCAAMSPTVVQTVLPMYPRFRTQCTTVSYSVLPAPLQIELRRASLARR